MNAFINEVFLVGFAADNDIYISNFNSALFVASTTT